MPSNAASKTASTPQLTPAMAHGPSDHDRSPTRLLVTPPSPPYNTPPEYRQLREDTLLRWVNHQLACTPAIASLADFYNQNTVIRLLAAVSGQPAPSEGPDAAASMLCKWIGHSDGARNLEAVLRGDPDQLLSAVLTQQQARILHDIQADMPMFTEHSPPPAPILCTEQQQSCAAPFQIKQVLLSWAQTSLADYVDARLLPQPIDNCSEAWQDGLAFLALVHRYDPDSVQDLQHFVAHNVDNKLHWEHTLTTAFRRAHDAFEVPELVDAHLLATTLHVDQDSIIAYLVEFLKAVHLRRRAAVPAACEQEERRLRGKRQADIERWCTRTSRRTTATFCSTQVRLTRVSTVPSTKPVTPPPATLSLEGGGDDAQQTRILDKVAELHQRLMHIAPTRSIHYHHHHHHRRRRRRQSSCATMPDSPVPSEYDMLPPAVDNNSHASSSSDSSSSNSNNQHPLHPLQAGYEDLRSYEQSFAGFQVSLHAFQQDDDVKGWLGATAATTGAIQEAYAALMQDVEQGTRRLEQFRQGFFFGRRCADVRSELDAVKTQMLKTTPASSDSSIEDMERRLARATSVLDELGSSSNAALFEHEPVYREHMDALRTKKERVQSWVDEVRVWFAEARRIRQWIEIRMARLEEVSVPVEPLQIAMTTRSEVEQLIAAQEGLEHEIEAFDRQDMARLRAHVNKALTGAGHAAVTSSKDLSPADTTTIEITLTTLTLREKLMSTLRRKRDDLDVLTQRLAWEEQLDKTQAWIRETDREVEAFIRDTARWQVAEDNATSPAQYRQRDQVVARERLKELVIQRLLILEKKRTEFDQGQFTTTMDSFRDLEDTANVDALPDHLEARQACCERQFENLFKRISFARQVVEQRLKMMEFLHQVHTTKHDAQQLIADLQEAQEKASADDTDGDLTTHVQAVHERIAQVVAAAGMSRIPYPQATLPADHEDNVRANEAIHAHVERLRRELLLTGEHVDNQVDALRRVLNMHRHGRKLLGEATRLYQWADDRMQHLRKARTDMPASAPDALTPDDLRRLERDREHLLQKLKEDKEDEAIDVLTRIQAFLEEVPRLKVSIDTENLEQVAQHLTDAFDHLRESLEDQAKDLAVLRKRAEDDSSHISDIDALRTYISETRAALPALKQSYGFMTGRSKEQDQERFDTLRETVDRITASYDTQRDQLQRLKEELQGADSKQVDNAEEVQRAMEHTVCEWDRLGTDLESMQQFTEAVGRWYARQRRLSVVEDEYLGKGSTQHNDTDSLDKAISMLDAIGCDIAEAAQYCRTDPLEAANYACAYDRHATLTEQVCALRSDLMALQQESNSSTQREERLHSLEVLLKQVHAEHQQVRARMAVAGQADFASMSAEQTSKLYQQLQRDTAGCATAVQQFRQQLVEQQCGDDSLLHERAKCVARSIAELEQDNDMLEKQAALVRRIQVHAEAAENLDTWISQCSSAVAQLANADMRNTADDLQEQQDAIGGKLTQIQPVIRTFHAMPGRIFSGSAPQIDGVDEQAAIKTAVHMRQERTMEAYRQLLHQFDDAKTRMQVARRDADVAHTVKDILTLVGGYKDRACALRLSKAFSEELGDACEWNDMKMATQCPLSMMPNEHELRDYQTSLMAIEQDIEQHLQQKLDDLDNILGNAITRSKELFSGQRAEIAMAVRGLADLLKMKHDAALAAEKVEPFLTLAEEIDVMLSTLSEAVERASPSQARVVGGLPSRADLQAMLIDLDTRFRYYQPKINRLLKEAYDAAQNAIRDKRVADCLDDLKYKWTRLQQQAAARRSDLASRIGPVVTPFSSTRLSGDTVSTRSKRASMPPGFTTTPRSIQSTPRFAQPKARPQSMLAARAPALPTTRPPAPPGPRPQQPQLRVRGRQSTATSEAYVPDPRNDLDVAVGNIVNDSPYKVRIKMVPGEVGRYWFGEKRPKLAYCRILGSRMVMVRVGGGWVELSQFLRDQKLLEHGRYVPRDASSTTPAVVNNNNNNMTTLRGGNGNSRNSSPVDKRGATTPTSQYAGSSPLHRGGGTTFGHGIKDGNKALIPIDMEGNQVQVRMTKAKSHSSKFITPWRTR